MIDYFNLGFCPNSGFKQLHLTLHEADKVKWKASNLWVCCAVSFIFGGRRGDTNLRRLTISLWENLSGFFHIQHVESYEGSFHQFLTKTQGVRRIITDVRGQRRRHPSSSLSPSFPSLQRNKTPSKTKPRDNSSGFPASRFGPGQYRVYHPLAPTQSLLVSQQGEIDTSSPASGPLTHMCFVSSALPHWSSQRHSGGFTGGHLVMHCQRRCSPSPLRVRCVRGTTHTHRHTHRSRLHGHRHVERSDAGGSAWHDCAIFENCTLSRERGVQRDGRVQRKKWQGACESREKLQNHIFPKRLSLMILVSI